MNLDEYRALHATEADNSNIATVKDVIAAPVVTETPAEVVLETPIVPATPEVAAPVVTPVVTETPVAVPTKYNIDGVGEFTADEIKELKQSGLRQQDYTRKTQEVANARRENQQAIELFNYLKANPHIAKNMLSADGVAPTDETQLRSVNPDFTKVDALATEVSDLKLQREIDEMSKRYADFEVLEVLDTAMKKGFTNLEDAYTFSKGQKAVIPSTVVTTSVVPPVTPAAPVATIDIEAERAAIKAQLLQELEAERNSTSTIITATSGTPVTPNVDIPLSAEEDAVRMKMRMTVEEWKKYK